MNHLTALLHLFDTPLLEALIDGDPDVKVYLWLGDVVTGQVRTEADGVLFQHVPVVLPAPAVSEYLGVFT